MKKLILFILIFCISAFSQDKPTLLFYCGITMVKPMTEIAKIMEKKHNCTIKISQGGSQDLYDSIKYSKQGDLYLPGSDKYIKENIKDGFFGKSIEIGYNKASIFVKKSNPKNVKDLDDFLRQDLAISLCNPQSGSIGKNTKSVLLKYKGEDFLDEVYDNVTEIGTDSRNLNNALLENRVDATINWRATLMLGDNNKYIDEIEIDEKYAPKKKLMLTPLIFTKNPEIVKDFIDFSSSKQGQDIMKRYGFL